MKKKVSVLLAFLLVFSVLVTSCGGNEEEPSSVSAESSEDVISAAESSAETSSEASAAESSAEESKEPVVRTYRTPVSIGASYTSSAAAGADYEDSYGIELTDGIYAERESVSYNDTKLSGYGIGASSTVTFVLDLGETKDDLYAFEIDFLDTDTAGIKAPASFTVSVSDDGTTFTTLGNVRIKGESNSTCKAVAFESEENVSARYVRFAVTSAGFWIFIDEITVYADVEGASGDSAFDETVENAYKNASAADRGSIEKIKTGTPDKSLNRFDAVRNKTYTSSVKSAGEFADNGKKLTDGNVGYGIEDDTWTAYPAENGVEFVFDLGAVKDDIAAFSLHSAILGVMKIGFPTYVTFSVSADKKEWTEVGTVYAPTEYDSVMYEFVYESPYTLSGRYVKAALPATNEYEKYMLDEIGVYRYCTDTNDISFYPPVTFPEAETDVLWEKDSDWDEKLNLLLGLGVQVSSVNTPQGTDNNTKITSKVVTDGKHTKSNDIHNGFFFKFYGGSGRSMYFDIGHLSALSEFTAEFTDLASWAVHTPPTVTVSLSTDGKKWYSVGDIVISDREAVVSGTLTLEKAVKARFVCYSFGVNAWAGVSELEAFGTKNTEGAIDLKTAGFEEAASPEGVGKWRDSDPDVLGGVHDVFLAYYSKTADWTEETFKSVVSYVDKSGKSVDTMFDGVLFLMSGGFPSNSDGSTGGSNRYNKSDVSWNIKKLFSDKNNIGALDSVVGKMKTELGLSDDYKEVYFVSIYTPNSTDFGDVDGDGKSESSNSESGKEKIAKYLIDEYYKEMANHEYKNLVFGGFYWYNEGISEDSMAIVRFVTDTVHTHGDQVFWIPYYEAEGYSRWAEFGLDVACQQPNYAFHEDVAISRLDEAAAIAKQYGMCIEIEMDYRAGSSNELFTQKYLDYLAHGAKAGYMTDAIHMYYIGISNFTGSAYTTDTPKRVMYDCTYQFIKGTLDPVPDAVDSISASASADTKCEIELNPEGKDYIYKVYTSPSHGNVTITEDGRAFYYPDKGYTGSDTFSYVYSERLGYSEECVVNVTVG